MSYLDVRVHELLERIAVALETIASAVDNDPTSDTPPVFRMRDVDRAKVYSEHLGKKLSG